MNQELLKSLIHYDPDTGVMTWLRRDRSMFTSDQSCKTWNTRYAGTPLNNRNTYSGKTYKRATVLGKCYLQHRLVFIYLYDQSPDEVDHINGDGTDNRLVNLRVVDRKENAKNLKLHRGNKSGVSGITWDQWSNKWLVRIGVDGKGVNLGRTSDFFEAVCIRKSAENRVMYHKNHGMDRPY